MSSTQRAVPGEQLWLRLELCEVDRKRGPDQAREGTRVRPWRRGPRPVLRQDPNPGLLGSGVQTRPFAS